MSINEAFRVIRDLFHVKTIILPLETFIVSQDSAISLFQQEIKEICTDMELSESDAFSRWVSENIFNIDDPAEIDESILMDGAGAYGINIFHVDEHVDRSDQYISWAQVKFYKDFGHNITMEEIENFVATIGHLEDFPPDANDDFKRVLDACVAYGGISGNIKKRMIFATTGRLDPSIKSTINDKFWIQRHLDRNEAKISLEVWDIDKIISCIVTDETPTITINFDEDSIIRTDSDNNKKSVIGYISANDLVGIVKKYKEVLFLENPRESLGKSTPTNKSIMGTLADDRLRKKFWKLNNGITAVCTKFEESNIGSGYLVENFKVVNGRQTTFTLEQFDKPLDEIFVSLTIHEANTPKERNMISHATNTQNPVNPVDLITNNVELNDLVLQCKNYFRDFYFERQTKGFKSAKKSTCARVTRRRVLEKNRTARSYYAYKFNPHDAMMTSDKDLFSIGESYYDKIFTNRKIKELIVPFIFMTLLNELCRKWHQEIKLGNVTYKRDKEILSKNIVKYFILYFISHSINRIEESQRSLIEDKLIEDFRNLTTNDKIPDELLSIVKTGYFNFKDCYNRNRGQTWPDDMFDPKDHQQLKNPRSQPTPYQIMNQLKSKGASILEYVMTTKDDKIKEKDDDDIKSELLALISN